MFQKILCPSYAAERSDADKLSAGKTWLSTLPAYRAYVTLYRDVLKGKTSDKQLRLWDPTLTTTDSDDDSMNRNTLINCPLPPVKEEILWSLLDGMESHLRTANGKAEDKQEEFAKKKDHEGDVDPAMLILTGRLQLPVVRHWVYDNVEKKDGKKDAGNDKGGGGKKEDVKPFGNTVKLTPVLEWQEVSYEVWEGSCTKLDADCVANTMKASAVVMDVPWGLDPSLDIDAEAFTADDVSLCRVNQSQELI